MHGNMARRCSNLASATRYYGLSHPGDAEWHHKVTSASASLGCTLLRLYNYIVT